MICGKIEGKRTRGGKEHRIYRQSECPCNEETDA